MTREQRDHLLALVDNLQQSSRVAGVWWGSDETEAPLRDEQAAYTAVLAAVDALMGAGEGQSSSAVQSGSA